MRKRTFLIFTFVFSVFESRASLDRLLCLEPLKDSKEGYRNQSSLRYDLLDGKGILGKILYGRKSAGFGGYDQFQKVPLKDQKKYDIGEMSFGVRIGGFDPLEKFIEDTKVNSHFKKPSTFSNLQKKERIRSQKIASLLLENISSSIKRNQILSILENANKQSYPFFREVLKILSPKISSFTEKSYEKVKNNFSNSKMDITFPSPQILFSNSFHLIENEKNPLVREILQNKELFSRYYNAYKKTFEFLHSKKSFDFLMEIQASLLVELYLLDQLSKKSLTQKELMRNLLLFKYRAAGTLETQDGFIPYVYSVPLMTIDDSGMWGRFSDTVEIGDLWFDTFTIQPFGDTKYHGFDSHLIQYMMLSRFFYEEEIKLTLKEFSVLTWNKNLAKAFGHGKNPVLKNLLTRSSYSGLDKFSDITPNDLIVEKSIETEILIIVDSDKIEHQVHYSQIPKEFKDIEGFLKNKFSISLVKIERIEIKDLETAKDLGKPPSLIIEDFYAKRANGSTTKITDQDIFENRDQFMVEHSLIFQNLFDAGFIEYSNTAGMRFVPNFPWISRVENFSKYHRKYGFLYFLTPL